jgi:hypothetical protein
MWMSLKEAVMRKVMVAGMALLPLAACAGTPERMVEVGHTRGALAVAAIDRGDLARAEQLLAESPLDASDPARLINVGYVRWERGQRSAALTAWRQALTAPRHEMVTTMTGREVRTDQLAREALARYGSAYAASE